MMSGMKRCRAEERGKKIDELTKKGNGLEDKLANMRGDFEKMKQDMDAMANARVEEARKQGQMDKEQALKDSAQEMEESNIIVNYQAVPSDESFTSSSGLRMGVAEMTRFGMKEDDFREFAPLFVEAVQGKNVGEEVARFRERFQSMHYCFDSELYQVRSRLARLF